MSASSPVPITQSCSVPLTASTTTAFPAFSVGYPISGLTVVAKLTGMSAGTLDIYLQESWNGGAAWNDVGHFTQVAANAAAATTRLSVTTTGSGASDNATAVVVGSGTTAAPGVALAAAKFVDGPWAPMLRIVSVTGTGTNSAAVVQTLAFYPWRPSQGS